MPNIQSAMKRMRSDSKKRTRRESTLSELKTLDKKLHSLTQDPAKAKSAAEILIRKLDKAASRRVIPKQRASRKKSRIQRWVLSLSKKA